MGGGITLTTPTPIRSDLQAEGYGLKFQAAPINAMPATVALTSGMVYAVLVGLKAGETITNMCTMVTSGGSSLSLVKLGLYDTAGTRLAVTADVKANFAGSGVKTSALSAAYTVPVSGAYYAVMLCTHTGTGPTIPRSAALTFTAFGSGVALVAGESGQTDLDATCTLTAAATSHGLWLAGN